MTFRKFRKTASKKPRASTTSITLQARSKTRSILTLTASSRRAADHHSFAVLLGSRNKRLVVILHFWIRDEYRRQNGGNLLAVLSSIIRAQLDDLAAILLPGVERTLAVLQAFCADGELRLQRLFPHRGLQLGTHRLQEILVGERCDRNVRAGQSGQALGDVIVLEGDKHRRTSNEPVDGAVLHCRD